MSLDRLERKLGYHFNDRKLLSLALTHRSQGGRNNERLEFLGDAVLGHVISEWLYHEFPESSERDLTLMRASLVKGESLTELAREVGLGEHLQLGWGERRSGGHQRASILANTLEAVIGAVLEDGGFQPTARLVYRLFQERFESGRVAVEQDAKTRLQEVLQARRRALPEYRVIRQEGDDHDPLFTVECELAAMGIRVEGQASTRRDAEKAAARLALAVLEEADDD